MIVQHNKDEVFHSLRVSIAHEVNVVLKMRLAINLGNILTNMRLAFLFLYWCFHTNYIKAIKKTGEIPFWLGCFIRNKLSDNGAMPSNEESSQNDGAYADVVICFQQSDFHDRKLISFIKQLNSNLDWLKSQNALLDLKLESEL